MPVMRVVRHARYLSQVGQHPKRRTRPKSSGGLRPRSHGRIAEPESGSGSSAQLETAVSEKQKIKPK